MSGRDRIPATSGVGMTHDYRENNEFAPKVIDCTTCTYHGICYKCQGSFSEWRVRESIQDTEIMRAALERYGEGSQIKKAIKELGELIVALAKEDVVNIKDEIANVGIMLDQLCLILDYDPESRRQYKLGRLRRRMGMGE